ncbi:MAG: hypothetical protein R3A48_28445 [Polyangiales bacterium]
MAAVTLVDDAEAFTVEDLIVRAWEQFPESFALRGYHARHPDSNRVLAKLSGTDGLCGLGWLEHTDQRMYRITRKGRLVAKQLSAIQAGTAREEAAEVTPERPTRAVERPAVKVVAPAVEKPAKAPAARVERPSRARSERAAPRGPVSPLTDSEKYALMMIARGDALRKFLRGSPLAFSDACAFWGISSSMRHQLVQSRLDSTAELLKRAVETFGGDGPADPGVPTLATCYGLFNLDRLMREKFAREVDALRLPVAAGSEG